MDTMPRIMSEGWKEFLGCGGFDFVCELDRDLRYLAFTPNYLDLLGLPRQAMEGHTPFELGFLHEEDLPDIAAALAPLFEANNRVRFEYRVRDGAGAWHWMESSGSPFLTPDGDWRALFISRDITDRRKMLASLAASEERYRLVFQHSPLGLLHFDAQGVLQVCNDAFLQQMGSTRDQLNRLDMLHDLSDPKVQQAIRDAVEGRRGFYEGPYRSVTGDRQTYLRLHTYGITAATGTFLGGIGMVEDITEHRLAEEVLRQTQKVESLGVLAGGIAHDFNNLLTALLGNLNLAQLVSPPDSPALAYLEAVEQTALRAADLTRQMLAYSGRGRFLVAPQNLNGVVQEMAHLLRVSIPRKIALRPRLEPDLPVVEGDIAQLQQVVMNLVTNAADAIGNREGTIVIATGSVELDAEGLTRVFSPAELSPGRYVTLEVRDTGSGIPPDILERIFDPFFSTKASGRGLGLSAMLGILRGHGGGYQIASEPGQGTAFRVFLPAVQAPAPPTPPDRLPVSSPLKGRVLLVDDEPSIRESLTCALQSFGLEVTVVVDGQEALECFQQNSEAFALVLMDLTMPRLDGCEAFRRMRRINPAVPVILSSGYHEHEHLEELHTLGLAGFLQKPYPLKELRRLVTDLLPQPPAPGA